MPKGVPTHLRLENYDVAELHRVNTSLASRAYDGEDDHQFMTGPKLGSTGEERPVVTVRTKDGRTQRVWVQRWLLMFPPHNLSEVPPHVQANHTCKGGHKGCTRTTHLEPGNAGMNQCDRRESDRQRTGRKVLTEAQARRAKFGGEPLAVLAAEFGVSIRLISYIREGKRWAHLQPEEAV